MLHSTFLATWGFPCCLTPAVKVALSARLREGKLKVVDELKSDAFSTTGMLKSLEASALVGGDCFRCLKLARGMQS